MNKWIVFLASGVLILPLCLPARNLQEVPALAQQILDMTQKAIQNYKEDNVTEGATLLCDVVLMTRPRDSWPEGFFGALGSARESFRNAAFPEGVSHIKRAINIHKPDHMDMSAVTSGSKAAIAQLILTKIESAIENFKTGDADSAVLLILESLALLNPAR